MSTAMDLEVSIPKLLNLLRRANKDMAKDPEAVKIFNQTRSEKFTALERRLSGIICQAETIYSSQADMDKALVLMKNNVVDQIIEGSIQAVKNLPATAPQLIPQSHVHGSAHSDLEDIHSHEVKRNVVLLSVSATLLSRKFD
ncbi:hypothetical protein ACFX13_025838 [Malus domestica]